MKRLIFALIFLMALTFAPARGQSSPDLATESWQSQVEAFALGISSGGSIEALVSSDATLREFGATETRPVGSLSTVVSASRVISAHAGTNPMIGLASDLSADARDAELETRFIQVLDVTESNRRDADSLAARWVAAELGAQTEDPIALIVLFQSTQADSQLHFILVKGRQQAGGKTVVVHVVHATLDQLLR